MVETQQGAQVSAKAPESFAGEGEVSSHVPGSLESLRRKAQVQRNASKYKFGNDMFLPDQESLIALKAKAKPAMKADPSVFCTPKRTSPKKALDLDSKSDHFRSTTHHDSALPSSRIRSRSAGRRAKSPKHRSHLFGKNEDETSLGPGMNRRRSADDRPTKEGSNQDSPHRRGISDGGRLSNRARSPSRRQVSPLPAMMRGSQSPVATRTSTDGSNDGSRHKKMAPASADFLDFSLEDHNITKTDKGSLETTSNHSTQSASRISIHRDTSRRAQTVLGNDPRRRTRSPHNHHHHRNLSSSSSRRQLLQALDRQQQHADSKTTIKEKKLSSSQLLDVSIDSHRPPDDHEEEESLQSRRRATTRSAFHASKNNKKIEASMTRTSNSHKEGIQTNLEEKQRKHQHRTKKATRAK